MSQQQFPEIAWKTLTANAPYPREAYAFVQEGLGYTVRLVHGDPSKLPAGERHVNGRDLCEGLREYAIKKYGLMARSVLEHWHIHRTEDFGRIVFGMVDAGLMSSTDEDSMADFVGVYSFEDAFDRDHVMAALGHA